ncbi:MAG: hypothetical protein ACM3PT_01965 [Deltaproteobacteria bacterium]
MIKYNKNSLEKIVNLFSESAYKVRFEKGNFISGHAVVHDKKVIVVNRFLQIDMKINSLLEILYQIIIDTNILSPGSLKFYRELKKSGLIRNGANNKSKSEEE